MTAAAAASAAMSIAQMGELTAIGNATNTAAAEFSLAKEENSAKAQLTKGIGKDLSDIVHA